MLTGFALAVLADRFHAELGLADYAGLAKYVVPWIAAFGVALVGTRPPGSGAQRSE